MTSSFCSGSSICDFLVAYMPRYPGPSNVAELLVRDPEEESQEADEELLFAPYSDWLRELWNNRYELRDLWNDVRRQQALAMKRQAKQMKQKQAMKKQKQAMKTKKQAMKKKKQAKPAKPMKQGKK